MNIKGQMLYAEMQSMSAQARSLGGDFALKKSTELTQINPSQSDFTTMFKNALSNVNGLQQETSGLRTRLEMGDSSVSLAQVMISAQKSSLAFEATVQVRNKMVEAYKDIMSMPV